MSKAHLLNHYNSTESNIVQFGHLSMSIAPVLDMKGISFSITLAPGITELFPFLLQKDNSAWPQTESPFHHG